MCDSVFVPRGLAHFDTSAKSSIADILTETNIPMMFIWKAIGRGSKSSILSCSSLRPSHD